MEETNDDFKKPTIITKCSVYLAMSKKHIKRQALSFEVMKDIPAEI